MTDADISDRSIYFLVSIQNVNKFLKNIQHHPKIEYPGQLKEKGIR